MLRNRTLVTLLLIVALGYAINAQTPSYTYQGRLTESALPAAGTYQMQFTVYDAESGGAVVGTTITNTSVTVANGVFTVSLDYSPQTPFGSGADRWIEIAVKKPAEGSFTTMTPRQKVTSSPYATKSLSSSDSDSLGGLAANTYLQTNGNGSGLTNLNGANITNNTISSAALASDTFPINQNLSRLGQLRWDQLGQKVAVATSPQGVAFDGANIWVANQISSNVIKLRASDGSLQGTFTVGTNPNGVAFDGENIWVVNQGSNDVTKLLASDGTLQGTFTVGSNPYGIAFDGANIWVANSGSNTVTKLRASDGACAGVVGPPTPACTFAVGGMLSPRRIAFDGTNVWITNSGSNNVTKLRASDGLCVGGIGSCLLAVGSSPYGVAFDGANVWVTNAGSNNVTKLRSSDGFLLGTFSVGAGPFGLVFDGANIWVSNSGSNTVTRLRASDAVSLGIFAAATFPSQIAFDGANVWVANANSNNVIKLPVFP